MVNRHQRLNSTKELTQHAAAVVEQKHNNGQLSIPRSTCINTTVTAAAVVVVVEVVYVHTLTLRQPCWWHTYIRLPYDNLAGGRKRL